MYLKDGPLRRSSECIAMHSKCISKTVPEGVLIISLLNVCFNILQEISNAKGGKEGERGIGEEEEDEEGGNFKFSFVFFL